VADHSHLFALGDVTDVQEEKLAFLAAQQATLVAANLTALAAAAAAAATVGDASMQAAGSKLRCWRPSAGIQVLFVSIGRE
jgi:NADH dehydrogenase FAD-containing subunit